MFVIHRTSIFALLVLGLVATGLGGCSDNGSQTSKDVADEDTVDTADLSDVVDIDGTDTDIEDAVDTADTTDTGDVITPPPRTMVTQAPLEGLPAENRVLSPWLQPVQGFVVFSSMGTALKRHVFAETPYQSPVAKLLGGGRDVDLVLYGQAGEGMHTASVWIGAESDTAILDASITIIGITLGNLTGEVAAIDLTPPSVLDETNTIEADGRFWVHYQATFTARTGTFWLAVQHDGSTNLMVHAPIVQVEIPDPGGTVLPLRPARRVDSNELRRYQSYLQRFRDAPPIPSYNGSIR